VEQEQAELQTPAVVAVVEEPLAVAKTVALVVLEL
jgi:hypothetical protein